MDWKGVSPIIIVGSAEIYKITPVENVKLKFCIKLLYIIQYKIMIISIIIIIISNNYKLKTVIFFPGEKTPTTGGGRLLFTVTSYE